MSNNATITITAKMKAAIVAVIAARTAFVQAEASVTKADGTLTAKVKALKTAGFENWQQTKPALEAEGVKGDDLESYRNLWYKHNPAKSKKKGNRGGRKPDAAKAAKKLMKDRGGKANALKFAEAIVAYLKSL